MKSSLTAIIVTYNSGHVLADCLRSFREINLPVIVVDNASTDNTVHIAKEWGVKVISNPVNEGYGRANNIGVRHAETDYILITNPDIILDGEKALAALEAAVYRYPEAAIYGPRITEKDGRIFFAMKPLLARILKSAPVKQPVPDGDACVSFLSGACLLIRRDDFLNSGGFDENIFLFYEDDDLCRRFVDRGRALVWVQDALAWHGRGQSSEIKKGSRYRTRWHLAWSSGYISQKYGLKCPARKTLIVSLIKAVGAALTWDSARWERHMGSAAGSWAWLKGKEAFLHHPLVDEPPVQSQQKRVAQQSIFDVQSPEKGTMS